MGSNSGKPLHISWLDLTISTQESSLPSFFYEHCNIVPYSDFEALRARFEAQLPDALLIDFDYPSKADLAAAAALKSDFPSVPMLMLTVQHSESLAVWAFRSRMLDYFVKPLARAEVEHCMNLLRVLAERRGKQQKRHAIPRHQSVPSEANSRQPPVHVALAPAISFVEKHFRDRIRNEDVAEACGMNAFYFSKRFKETFDIGFHEYLTRYRLREARRLLEVPSSSVTQVCFASGFNDASYFSRVFKKYFGELPSSFVGVPLTEKLSDDICADYFPTPLDKRPTR